MTHPVGSPQVSEHVAVVGVVVVVGIARLGKICVSNLSVFYLIRVKVIS